MRKEITLNLFMLVTIPLSLWLGFTDRVDWWIIGFVWIMNTKLTATWRERD